MDREVWLMLMCYPTDARSLSLIGKASCGFAHLLPVHPSVTLNRVIVKALVNREQEIPDDFVVFVGDTSSFRSLTVQIFILYAIDVNVGGDEELPPIHRPAHPLPFPTPRWLYPPAEASESSSTVLGNVGHEIPAEHVAAEPKIHDEQEAIVDLDVPFHPVVDAPDSVLPNPTAKLYDINVQVSAMPSAAATLQPAPVARDFAASVGLNDSLMTEAAATSSRKALSKVIKISDPYPSGTPFVLFAHVNRLVVNLDSPVPAHFTVSDTLWHLAKILVDPLDHVLG
jgi:hypothetical protein